MSILNEFLWFVLGCLDRENFFQTRILLDFRPIYGFVAGAITRGLSAVHSIDLIFRVGYVGWFAQLRSLVAAWLLNITKGGRILFPWYVQVFDYLAG